MSKPFVRIITNDTVIDREMNDDEYAQWQMDKAEAEARAETQAEAAAAKATARTALLAKLGITESEAQLLLG